METKRVATSAEVYAVIMARHRDELGVFSSFSDPTGTFNGGPGETGVMMTEYGFSSADAPLIGAETRWNIAPDQSPERINERHIYWLCLPLEDD